MPDFKYIIIHCSASPPDVTADAAAIDRWHRQRGWKKNGYHEVITRDGVRQNHAGGYKTRPMSQNGAHVGGCGKGWNRISIGICLEGGVDADGNPENNFTEEQLSALREAIDHYQAEYGIFDGHVMGHRDLIAMTDSDPKACPSFDVRTWWLGGEETTAPNEEPPVETPVNEEPVQMDIEEFIGERRTHVVVHGDTLWDLAMTYGVTVDALREANRITDDRIYIGQKLGIPAER